VAIHVFKNRDYMDEQELCAAVKDFERVVKSSEWLLGSRDSSVHTLCLFYAMRSAFAVRAIYGDQVGEQAASASIVHSLPCPSIPRLDVVKTAALKLMIAARSYDRNGISSALDEMGVLALCPIPAEQLSKMESVVGHLSGRSRLIALVELSVFAVESGDHRSAGRYIQESRALNPSSCELHNVCVVEGVIALAAGEVHEAIRLLDSSLAACLTDEYASLSCSVRAPNLALAQKLLERGERIEVLRYLSGCKNVWSLLRQRIDTWINVIERGEMPNFQESRGVRALNRPSHKLAMQWLRASSAEIAPRLAAPKSPAEVLAGRERLRAEYRRYVSSVIRRKVEP
jgi:hypothetical protein